MEDQQPLESDDESGSMSEDAISLQGFKMSPSKLIELCHVVQKPKSLELCCLKNVRRKQERRKRKKRWRSKPHSPPDSLKLENVSETASRTTTSTTECWDAKRPSLSRFDYFHEDSHAPRGDGTTLPKRKPVARSQDKKLANLNSIVAEIRGHQHQREHNDTPATAAKQNSEQLVQSPFNLQSFSNYHVNREDVGHELLPQTSGPLASRDDGSDEDAVLLPHASSRLPGFNFDGDSDSESPNRQSNTNECWNVVLVNQHCEKDIKLSIISQINRVEKLLDSEALK